MDGQVDVSQSPEVLAVSPRATGVDHAFLERLVLADDESLGHAVHPDDDRRSAGVGVGGGPRGLGHHISWAKSPCRRANTRWEPTTSTSPTRSMTNSRVMRLSGNGASVPATQKVRCMPRTAAVTGLAR